MENNEPLGDTSNFRPNNYDLIRLLAALQVVYFHGVEHLNLVWLKDTRWSQVLSYFPGVPIFFFMSGVMVCASFRRSKSGVQYFAKRFLRIFPGLWVCLFVSIVSVWVLSEQEVFNYENFGSAFIWLVAQLSFLQVYNPTFLQSYGVGVLNGSLWTIPVEIQFYCAVPILSWVVSKGTAKSEWRVGRLLVCLCIFFTISQVFVQLRGDAGEGIAAKLVKYSMLPYFWVFLLGALAQLFHDKILPVVRGKAILWLCIHLAVVGLVEFLGWRAGTNNPSPMVVFSLAAFTLAFAYTKPNLSNWLLRGVDISYGTYIYHMVVVNALLELGAPLSALSLMLVFLITLALSLASWYAVEKPALALKYFFTANKATAGERGNRMTSNISAGSTVSRLK